MIEDLRVAAFDCDGVLFDTLSTNQAYYNAVLSRFGKPPLTPEQLAYSHMHTGDQAIAMLFPHKEEFEAAQRFRHSLDYRQFFRHMVMEPHLMGLLAKLRPKYKTAIATNRADTLGPLLAEFGLRDWFDLVVSSLDAPRPKPHPDQLLKILNHFGAKPAQAVYIGDSEVDEAAAASAQVPFIAYRNPRLSALFHITSLKELETILNL